MDEEPLERLKQFLIVDTITFARNITRKIIKHGAWIALDSMDSMDIHFSSMREDFDNISFCISPAEEECNLEDALSEFLQELKDFTNNYVITTCQDESCFISNFLEDQDFEIQRGNLFYISGTNLALKLNDEEESFYKVRVCQKPLLLTDSYGLKHVSMKNCLQVCRGALIERKIRKDENVLDYGFVRFLCMECFPCYKYLWTKDRDKIKIEISDKEMMEGYNSDMNPQLYKEASIEDIDEALVDIDSKLYLSEVIKRASSFGYIINNKKFLTSLINDKNKIIVDEIRKEFVCQFES